MQRYIISCLILFLISNSSEQNNTPSFYILPLTIENVPNSVKKTEKTTEEIINSFLNMKHKVNTLYTGTPKNLLDFELSFDTYSLYMSSNKVNNNIIDIKKYDPSKSSTYEELKKESEISEYQKCSLCAFAKEKFYILENKNLSEFSGINFVLGNKLANNSYDVSASIGLKPKKSTSSDLLEDNLIMQLKLQKYLLEYVFRIRYSNKKNKDIFNNGELIIGSYPHQYIPSVYDEKNFKYFYILTTKEKWEFSPSQIYYGMDKLIIPYNKYEIPINLNNIFIKGTQTLLSALRKSFFEELEKNGQCETYNVTNLLYFICNENINITKMENLVIDILNSFEHINITFTPNDLFYKYKDKNDTNKLLFLVCFSDSYSIWELGNIFIRKYQPVFNFDKKYIGFYNEIFSDQEDEYKKFPYDDEDKKENNSVNVALIVAVIIVSLLLIGLAVFFYLFVKSRRFRTKRANELTDDDYMYESKIIDDSNDNDKKDKLINS